MLREKEWYSIKILITGGSKNGKSFYAQEILLKLADSQDKFYIATMQPCDQEDEQRIKRHREEREGYGFITLEQPRNVAKCIESFTQDCSVLLDSTTALLSNEMFLQKGEINDFAWKNIVQEILEIGKAAAHVVVVSDYIYSDAQRYDEYTEAYRRNLAAVDKALAKEFDVVCEVSFGGKIFHKGNVRRSSKAAENAAKNI